MRHIGERTGEPQPAAFILRVELQRLTEQLAGASLIAGANCRNSLVDQALCALPGVEDSFIVVSTVSGVLQPDPCAV